jgi:DNA-binding NarL/FixJ family response regulator
MTTVAKILLVDDHAMVRDMLKRQIDAEAGMQVVVAAADMGEAVLRAEGVDLDLAVLDIEMPGLSVFEGVGILRQSHPGLRVMFLSGFHSDRNIQRALEVRACGYASKSEPLPNLIAAIRSVAEGQSYFSPQVQARLIADGLQCASEATCTRLETLTKRELEILGYLARGWSKKEIANTTGTSVKTVEQHCSNIMAKLDIHDRVKLARFAIQEGVSLV